MATTTPKRADTARVIPDPRLIDSLVVFALVLAGSGALAGQRDAANAGVIVGGLIVLGLLWALWRRLVRASLSSRVVTAIFALGAVALYFIIGNVSSLGLQWVAVTMLAFDAGVLASGVFGAVLVGVTLASHAVAGSDLVRVLLESVGVAMLLGLGIEFAALVRRAQEIDAERREALDSLARAYEEQQQRHGREQDLVLAEERARIATALHDGLGHRLTAIGMMLDFSERRRHQDPERAAEEVRAARAATGEALDDMRRVVRAMHPVATDPDDLVSSLAAVADSFDSTGLEVTFACRDAEPIDREIGLVLLRVVQEGLTNVVRHAGAARVRVELEQDAHGVRLAIRDDGAGSGEVTEGFGLHSLRERAEATGGTVVIEPGGGIDGGLALVVTLPQQREPVAA